MSSVRSSCLWTCLIYTVTKYQKSTVWRDAIISLNGWWCVFLYSAGIPHVSAHVAAGVAHGFATRSGWIGWYRQGEVSAEVEEVLPSWFIAVVALLVFGVDLCCFIIPDVLCGQVALMQQVRRQHAVLGARSMPCLGCQRTRQILKRRETSMSSSTKSSTLLDLWEFRGFKGQEMARQYKSLKAFGDPWRSMGIH